MAQNVAANAAAFSAAAHVESERHISERLVQARFADVGGAVLAAAEAVQNHDRRSALAFDRVRRGHGRPRPVSSPSDSKVTVVLHQNGPARKA